MSSVIHISNLSKIYRLGEIGPTTISPKNVVSFRPRLRGGDKVVGCQLIGKLSSIE